MRPKRKKVEIKNRWKNEVIYTAKFSVDFKGSLIAAALLAAIASGADLRRADLRGADLYGADLRRADLQGADLRGASLYGADLYGADLQGANLYGADLRRADLRGANLYGADLRGASLYGADLQGANLRDAVNAALSIAQTIITPEGSLIGWKKCQRDVLVKVLIPAEAKRSSSYGRKCRAEYVETLEVFGADVGVSLRDNKTEYKAGTVTRCDDWCEDRWQECAGGIHFFLTRKEAESFDY